MIEVKEQLEILYLLQVDYKAQPKVMRYDINSATLIQAVIIVKRLKENRNWYTQQHTQYKIN